MHGSVSALLSTHGTYAFLVGTIITEVVGRKNFRLADSADLILWYPCVPGLQPTEGLVYLPYLQRQWFRAVKKRKEAEIVALGKRNEERKLKVGKGSNDVVRYLCPTACDRVLRPVLPFVRHTDFT